RSPRRSPHHRLRAAGRTRGGSATASLGRRFLAAMCSRHSSLLHWWARAEDVAIAVRVVDSTHRRPVLVGPRRLERIAVIARERTELARVRPVPLVRGDVGGGVRRVTELRLVGWPLPS